MGTKSAYIRNWFGDSGFGEEDTPESQNPEVDHEDGLKISKVQFNDLIKEFPNPLSVCSNRFMVLSIFETRFPVIRRDYSARNPHATAPS